MSEFETTYEYEGIYDRRTLRQIIQDEHAGNVADYCSARGLDDNAAHAIRVTFGGLFSPHCFSQLISRLADMESSTPEILFPRHLYRDMTPLHETLAADVLVDQFDLSHTREDGLTITEFFAQKGIPLANITYLRQVMNGMRAPSREGQLYEECKSVTKFIPEVLGVHHECTQDGLSELPRLEETGLEPSFELPDVDDAPFMDIKAELDALLRDVAGMFGGERREIMHRWFFEGEGPTELAAHFEKPYTTITSTIDQAKKRIRRDDELVERADRLLRKMKIMRERGKTLLASEKHVAE